MSDFLTNLAAKNLELTTSVQPRTASLFEAVQPGTGALNSALEIPLPHPVAGEDEAVSLPTPLRPAWQERLSFQTTETRPAFESIQLNKVSAPAPEISPVPPAPLFSPKPAITKIISTEFGAEPISSVLPPRRSENNQVSSQAGLASAPPKPPLVQPELPKAGFVETPLPTRLPLLGSKERLSGREADRSETQVILATEARPAPGDQNQAEPKKSPELQETETVRPAVTPYVVQPRLAPLVPPAQPISAQPPLAAPTINVTIGRIEVRATPPSTGPRRPTSPNRATGPSLEEYLRQRSRGGRP